MIKLATTGRKDNLFVKCFRCKKDILKSEAVKGLGLERRNYCVVCDYHLKHYKHSRNIVVG